MSIMSVSSTGFSYGTVADVNGGFFARVTNGVKRYVILTRAERQLSQLDDRMLRDIGITRTDIHRLVWGH